MKRTSEVCKEESVSKVERERNTFQRNYSFALAGCMYGITTKWCYPILLYRKTSRVVKKWEKGSDLYGNRKDTGKCAETFRF